jgi:hypothetical protein
VANPPESNPITPMKHCALRPPSVLPYSSYHVFLIVVRTLFLQHQHASAPGSRRGLAACGMADNVHGTCVRPPCTTFPYSQSRGVDKDPVKAALLVLFCLYFLSTITNRLSILVVS